MLIAVYERLLGCTGALAREMAKAYPSSTVTVFDLQQVVEVAQKHFSQENDAIVFQSGKSAMDDLKHLKCLRKNIHGGGCMSPTNQ